MSTITIGVVAVNDVQKNWLLNEQKLKNSYIVKQRFLEYQIQSGGYFNMTSLLCIGLLLEKMLSCLQKH